jgi:hypothetical protein
MTDAAYKQAPQDDLTVVTDAAKAELDRAVQLAGLQRDPLRHSFYALGVHLDAMHRIAAGHIQAAQRPINDDDLRRLMQSAASGAWRMTAEMIHAHNWRTALLGIAVALVAIVSAFGGGYWYRGAAPNLVGVRAGTEKCEDRPDDGSRLCWIPVFERLPAKMSK